MKIRGVTFPKICKVIKMFDYYARSDTRIQQFPKIKNTFQYFLQGERTLERGTWNKFTVNDWPQPFLLTFGPDSDYIAAPIIIALREVIFPFL